MNFVFFILSFFSTYLQYQANDKTSLLLNMTFSHLAKSDSSIEIIKDLNSYFSDELNNGRENLINNYLINSDNYFIDLSFKNNGKEYTFTIKNMVTNIDKKITFESISNAKEKSQKLASEILKFTNKSLVPFTEDWIFDVAKLSKTDKDILLNVTGISANLGDRGMTLNESIRNGKAQIAISIEAVYSYLTDKKIDLSSEYKLSMEINDVPYLKFFENKFNTAYTKYAVNSQQIKKLLTTQKKATKEEIEKFEKLSSDDLKKINKLIKKLVKAL